MSERSVFQVERVGQTVVVTPLSDVDGSESDDLLTCDPGGAIKLLESGLASNVVVDCRRLPCCSSSSIAVFIRLGKRSLAHHGRVTLCNLSVGMRQIYDVLNLRVLWPAFDSLEEAITYVEQNADTADSAIVDSTRDSLS